MTLLIDIRRESGSATILLRPYAMWRTVATFTVIAVVAALLGFVPAPESVLARVMRLVMLPVIGFSTYGALVACAWYCFGREIVTATATTLSIEHRIVRRRRRLTTYSARRVQNLRAVGRGQVMRHARPVSAVTSALAFDYDGQSVRFAAGLRGGEAEAVVSALTEAMWAASPREVSRDACPQSSSPARR